MSLDGGLTARQEERLARYRAGAMSAPEREAFEREVLASDELAEALYREESLQAVTAGEPARVVEGRFARPRAGTPRAALRRTLLAFAAVFVAVTAGYALLGRGPGPSLDSPERGAGALARPLAPAGLLVAAPERFTWTRDPEAPSYRVELFATDGALLATAVTAETTLAYGELADSALSAGEWRVVPLDADGLERAAFPRVAFELPRR